MVPKNILESLPGLADIPDVFAVGVLGWAQGTPSWTTRRRFAYPDRPTAEVPVTVTGRAVASNGNQHGAVAP